MWVLKCVGVCMCGVCNMLFCVCVGFVICPFVYVWVLKCMCVCVCLCGFCNVWLCVSVGFVMGCGVYVWVL